MAQKKTFTIFSILLVAITISFLYGFKHLILLHERNWQIKETVFFTSFEAWDVDHYLTQIKEVYEGNNLLSNAYLAEYKQIQRSPWPLFPNFFIASVGKLLHIRVQHLAVLMDFFLPPLIFLLAYLLLSTLSSGKYLAISGAFFLAVIPHIFRLDILAYIGFDLLQNGYVPPLLDEAHCSYCFSGTTNPQLTYIFLLAALLFLARGLVTAKKRAWLFAGFFGVLTSYSYVYFSSYLYAFLGISVLWFEWRKDVERFRKSLILLGVILLCSIPFWLSLLNFSGEGMGQMASMQKTHRPIFSYSYINAHIREQIIFTVFICGFILYSVRKGIICPIAGMFAFGLLFSGILCLEQQIITGISVQPWHYDAYVNPQATILALTIVMMEMLASIKCLMKIRKRLILSYGGIALVILSVFFHPVFVAAYLSSDGVLTPALTLLVQAIHVTGLWFGIALIGFRLALHSRLFHYVRQFGANLCVLFRTIHSFGVQRIFYILPIMYISSDIALQQYFYYHQKLKPDFAYLQTLAPAFTWLNEHTPPESVVLGSPDHTSTNSIIPIYTHNNVYVGLAE